MGNEFCSITGATPPRFRGEQNHGNTRFQTTLFSIGRPSDGILYSKISLLDEPRA